MDQSPPHSPSRPTAPIASNRINAWIVRWLLFFLICLGLGYPAVQRYDPRRTEGLSDAAVYYRMVAGEKIEAREMRFRVLVPYIARPFHALARKFIEPERAVYASLLISNAIFCAVSACLLVALGRRITGNTATALLAATLYLLNFAVMNLQLAAMVDAGEACILLAVTLTLFSGRWWLLLVWGVLGTLAKETFVPLATVFALGWWFVAYRNRPHRWRSLLPIIAMITVMVATVGILRSTIAGNMAISDMLEQTHAGSGGFGGRLSVLFSPTVWYVFIWLLPLGAIRLNRLPRPWVLASLLSGVAVLIPGIYRDIGGNLARTLFDVLGPLLSLSAAIWLTEPGKSTATGVTSDIQS